MEKYPIPPTVKKISAVMVVAIILGVVGLASLSYAAYRQILGAEDNAALLIGGGMCAALAVIFAGRASAAPRR